MNNMPPKEATTAAQVNTLSHLTQLLTQALRPFQTGDDTVCESVQDDGTRAALEVALIDVGQRISLIATDSTRWTNEVDHEDARYTKALQIEQLRYMQAQRRVAEMMEERLRNGEDLPLDSKLIVGKIKGSNDDNQGTL
jgi:hypothetical protein